MTYSIVKVEKIMPIRRSMENDGQFVQLQQWLTEGTALPLSQLPEMSAVGHKGKVSQRCDLLWSEPFLQSCANVLCCKRIHHDKESPRNREQIGIIVELLACEQWFEKTGRLIFMADFDWLIVCRLLLKCFTVGLFRVKNKLVDASNHQLARSNKM